MAIEVRDELPPAPWESARVDLARERAMLELLCRVYLSGGLPGDRARLAAQLRRCEEADERFWTAMRADIRRLTDGREGGA